MIKENYFKELMKYLSLYLKCSFLAWGGDIQTVATFQFKTMISDKSYSNTPLFLFLSALLYSKYGALHINSLY